VLPATGYQLEIILDTKLNDARLTLLSRNTPKSAGVEVQLRIAPVEAVEEVERFDADFQPLRSGDVDRRSELIVGPPRVLAAEP